MCIRDSRRGRSHGHFDPSLMQAGVGDPEGLASIHNRRDRGGTRHEGGVDASFPEGFVPMNAAAEASEPLPESSGGSATTSHSVSAKKLGERGSRGPITARRFHDRSGDRGLGGNHFGLLSRDLHEHRIFKDMHSEVDGLGEFSDDDS